MMLALHDGLCELGRGVGTTFQVLLTVLAVAPVGFVLGMPFPLGLELLGRRARGAVPWAWAMNGLGTVAGGLASVVLSLAIGFRGALGVAAAFYLIAWLALSGLRGQSLVRPGFD